MYSTNQFVESEYYLSSRGRLVNVIEIDRTRYLHQRHFRGRIRFVSDDPEEYYVFRLLTSFNDRGQSELIVIPSGESVDSRDIVKLNN